MKKENSNKLNKKGFTLLELLVVVIIIGILAGIALPQYKRTVVKSQASQALSILQSLQQSYKSYYLVNGQWSNSFNTLDITIPWTGNTKWKTNLYSDVLSNKDWSLQLQFIDTRIPVMYIGRLTGAYRGYAFAYFFKNWGTGSFSVPANSIVCVEQNKEGAGVQFQKTPGDFCKKIMGSNNIIQAGDTTYFYDLP